MSSFEITLPDGTLGAVHGLPEMQSPVLAQTVTSQEPKSIDGHPVVDTGDLSAEIGVGIAVVAILGTAYYIQWRNNHTRPPRN